MQLCFFNLYNYKPWLGLNFYNLNLEMKEVCSFRVWRKWAKSLLVGLIGLNVVEQMPRKDIRRVGLPCLCGGVEGHYGRRSGCIF